MPLGHRLFALALLRAKSLKNAYGLPTGVASVVGWAAFHSCIAWTTSDTNTTGLVRVPVAESQRSLKSFSNTASFVSFGTLYYQRSDVSMCDLDPDRAA